MKRLPLVAATAFFFFAALSSQAQILGKSVAKYTTVMGTIFHRGDTLCFDKGTAKDGYFQYAYIPANAAINLPASHYSPAYNGHCLVIQTIRIQSGKKNQTPRAFAVLSSSGNSCVELDSAEAVREIITRRNRKPTAAIQGLESASAAISQVSDEPLYHRPRNRAWESIKPNRKK